MGESGGEETKKDLAKRSSGGGLSGLFSDATWLTLATATSYAAAYAYEGGYADYYGYPWWLIEVRVQTVVVMFFALLSVGAVVGLLSAVVLSMVSWLPMKPVVSFVRVFRWSIFIAGVVLALILLMFLSTEAESRSELRLVLFIQGAASLLYIVFEAIDTARVTRRYRMEGEGLTDFWTRLADERSQQESAGASARFGPHTLAGHLMRRRWFTWPFAIAGLAFLATMLLGGVAMVGWMAPRVNKVYLVSSTGSEDALAAIRRYGDVWIAARIDTTTQILSRSFVVLTLPEVAQREWRRVTFPRLRIEPEVRAGNRTGRAVSMTHGLRSRLQ